MAERTAVEPRSEAASLGRCRHRGASEVWGALTPWWSFRSKQQTAEDGE